MKKLIFYSLSWGSDVQQLSLSVCKSVQVLEQPVSPASQVIPLQYCAQNAGFTHFPLLPGHRFVPGAQLKAKRVRVNARVERFATV